MIMFRWILKFWCGLWISWLCLIATCSNDKLRIMAMAIAQHEVALHKDIVVMRRATTSDPHLQPPPLSGVLQYERRLRLVDNILHCDDLAAEKFRALQTVMDVWEWEDMLAIEDSIAAGTVKMYTVGSPATPAPSAVSTSIDSVSSMEVAAPVTPITGPQHMKEKGVLKLCAYMLVLLSLMLICFINTFKYIIAKYIM